MKYIEICNFRKSEMYCKTAITWEYVSISSISFILNHLNLSNYLSNIGCAEGKSLLNSSTNLGFSNVSFKSGSIWEVENGLSI